VAEVRLAGGEMVAVRRLGAAQAAAGPPPVASPALARLGDDAWRYADAYGAASLPAWEPLVMRPAAADADTPRWRLALAGGQRGEDEAAGRVAAVQARHRAAVDTDRELARVTAALREAAEFGRNRYSPTLLLADVTAALPAGSALVSFQADSASGSLVALAPRAAAIVQPLETVPGVAAPEIVGPVTREALLGRELERVTIRFAVDPSRRDGRGREAAP
jgi:hypothetical protein